MRLPRGVVQGTRGGGVGGGYRERIEGGRISSSQSYGEFLVARSGGDSRGGVDYREAIVGRGAIIMSPGETKPRVVLERAG